MPFVGPAACAGLSIRRVPLLLRYRPTGCFDRGLHLHYVLAPIIVYGAFDWRPRHADLVFHDGRRVR
jgi:hypothetical protein